MFNLLAVLKGVLTLANYIARLAHDKQLLDAGTYKALAETNQAQLEKISLALAARNSNSVPEGSDPDNRDRR